MRVGSPFTLGVGRGCTLVSLGVVSSYAISLGNTILEIARLDRVGVRHRDISFSAGDEAWLCQICHDFLCCEWGRLVMFLCTVVVVHFSLLAYLRNQSDDVTALRQGKQRAQACRSNKPDV